MGLYLGMKVDGVMKELQLSDNEGEDDDDTLVDG